MNTASRRNKCRFTYCVVNFFDSKFHSPLAGWVRFLHTYCSFLRVFRNRTERPPFPIYCYTANWPLLWYHPMRFQVRKIVQGFAKMYSSQENKLLWRLQFPCPTRNCNALSCIFLNRCIILKWNNLFLQWFYIGMICGCRYLYKLRYVKFTSGR